jgi:hypothetical protein
MTAEESAPTMRPVSAREVLADTGFSAAAGRESLDARLCPVQAAGLRRFSELHCAQRPRMSFFGKRYVENRLLKTLDKIRRLDEYFATEPELAAIELPAPIFIVTPVRSGSTFLHRLLAADPRARWARPWEVSYVPPARISGRATPAYFSRDPRIATLHSDMENLRRFYPQPTQLHVIGADLAEECFGLLEASFCSPSLMLVCDSPEYLDWLDGLSAAQWREAYGIYQRYLQFLHWCHPGSHWVLKSPVHEWNYAVLAELFPAATFILIHRDAAARAESFARILHANLAMLYRDLSREQVGRLAAQYSAIGQRRDNASRASLPGQRIIDIEFDKLTRQPMACVAAVYERAGLDLSPAAVSAMQAWLRDETARRQGHG